jgi:hypothetical protein
MNGMAKGKSFERAVAQVLGAWCGIELGRVPMSGAWACRKADIWPKDPQIDFPLAVECKKSEAWCLDQLFAGQGPFFDWVEQAESQGKEMLTKTGRFYLPVLIFSRNRRPMYIAARAAGVNVVGRCYMCISVGDISYMVMELADFIALNPYALYLQVALPLNMLSIG